MLGFKYQNSRIHEINILDQVQEKWFPKVFIGSGSKYISERKVDQFLGITECGHKEEHSSYHNRMFEIPSRIFPCFLIFSSHGL